MAEAHPVGFQWVMEAKARGARVIHVDPRFTRTSALADQHVTVRAGTDIAFLERFHYMLRVVKPSSPMSVGTWILTAYGAGSGHLEPFIVQAVWLVGTLAALLISARRLGRGPAQ
jgi:hypothetical protein